MTYPNQLIELALIDGSSGDSVPVPPDKRSSLVKRSHSGFEIGGLGHSQTSILILFFVSTINEVINEVAGRSIR